MSTILWIIGLVIAGAIVYSLLSREALFTEDDQTEMTGLVSEEYADEIRPDQNQEVTADQQERVSHHDAENISEQYFGEEREEESYQKTDAEFYNDMALITGDGEDYDLLAQAAEIDRIDDGDDSDRERLNGFSEDDDDDLPMGSKTRMKQKRKDEDLNDDQK